MNEPSVERVREVFEQWELYYSIIRNNYMLHEEITEALNQILSLLEAPPSVLDVGSGDGYMARESLRGISISRYEAIDLSEEALIRLEQDTPNWDGKRWLSRGDLTKVLPTISDDQFDVVFANYSLHHLNREQRKNALREISRILPTDGIFIWSDVVLDEGETREAYLQRLAKEMSENWRILNPEQRERGVQHIRESDFPETLSWMREAARNVGFDTEMEHVRNAYFGCWSFRKTS